MQKKTTAILWIFCALAANVYAKDEVATGKNSEASLSIISTDIATISIEQQHDFVNPNSNSALAVHFQLKENWHFYASTETAPGGMNLKLKPSLDKNFINFSEPIFPSPHLYFDKSLDIKLKVFSGNFTVYLPFRVADIKIASKEDILEGVRIAIEGAVCSDIQCRVPDFGDLSTEIRISFNTTMGKGKFTLPDLEKGGSSLASQGINYSIWFALGTAFIAGLALNIMPCVWPILPLIVMRLVKQSEQSKRKSIAMGLTFCFGILLFFACIAVANVILQSFYGTTFSWGDHLRNPTIVTALALLMVIMALFMFGVFTVTVPASISSKSGSGEGYLGSLGMGFLAAILSTPCSFGILTVAFVWAQVQPLALGTFAIMVIGLGMALPYAVLTSMPGLLKRLPKAGRWMELFKQTLGFILLIIAVKLVKAVPEDNKINVLYFAVVLSFCVWMWAGWVSYGTKLSRKILVRIIAVALAVFAFRFFFAPELINWREYNADLISKSQSEQKPVLIKFTAGWCTNCEVVDRLVYQRKNIAKLIEQKGVLAIKADTTEKDFPATLALKNIYHEPGVPVSMLFVPGQKEPIRWRGILFADELKKSLEKLPDSSR